MKRTLLVVFSSLLILALGVGAVALIATSRANAQASTNQIAGFARSVLGSQTADGIAHRGGPGMPGPAKPGRDGEVDTYLANALGITSEELSAAYQTAQEAMPEFDALLADTLGISTDELSAARKTAQEAAIQSAVENGDMTQKQADLIQARQALQGYIDREALTAQALGLSVEELQAERQAGSTMQDLLEKQGLTQEEFQAAMQTAYQAAVQQAVDDNVITQAQADLILSNEGGFGPGMGFPGFERGPKPDWGGRGGMRDFPPQPETDSGTQF